MASQWVAQAGWGEHLIWGWGGCEDSLSYRAGTSKLLAPIAVGSRCMSMRETSPRINPTLEEGWAEATTEKISQSPDHTIPESTQHFDPVM